MKKELEFIALALAFGAIMWVIDAVLDYFIAHYDQTFTEVLITDMPPQAGYMRSIIILGFLVFALVAAVHVQRATEPT